MWHGVIAMTYSVLMFYDDHRATVGKVFSRVAEAYCQRHGYHFKCHTQILDSRRNASWNKVLATRMLLDITCSDWVVWLDADVLIVNPEIPLHALTAPRHSTELLMSQDQWGPCAGFFCIYNGPWAKRLLDTWWFLGPTTLRDNRDCWEQDTIKLLMKYFPEITDRSELISENMVQNPTSTFASSALAMHYYGLPQEQAVKLAELVAAHGWTPVCHPSLTT
jgi:hypothetical protein